jgi:DNA mismatch repair protein MutL
LEVSSITTFSYEGIRAKSNGSKPSAMGKIRVLSDETASQVAAGEVVERPASLVKELVENSLDAGATRVWVDYARGGSRLVSVRDDGCGMDREDALLCLERHATSKIRAGADLATVRTMGFRGEALPSMASVSRFRLVTREPRAEAGIEVTVAGGRVETVREIGVASGTLVEVKELFYNLPARRKFLRGEETESAHIIHGLEGMALANPAVALECRRDGHPVFSLPCAESLAVRIRDIFGADHLAKLMEMEPMEGEGFRLGGFLARPGQGRRDRLRQLVILNGRPIHCPAVQQPLREAYAEALERGAHPLAVLTIEMDTELVDCNVHPAKREVRLRQPDVLRRAIFDAARAVITRARQDLVRPVLSTSPAPERAFHPENPQQSLPLEKPVVPRQSETVIENSDPASRSPVPDPADQFRLLGFVGEGYLVLEGVEGLVLLDTRAAAERILFETLMSQLENGTVSSQRLLISEVAELPVREHAWVVDHLDDLRRAGFHLEPFGGNTLKIEGLPAAAAEREPASLLHEVISNVRAAGSIPRGGGVREALVRSVSRLAAEEKFPTDETRARRLVRELLRCELPYASPSGRPTMIQFSFAELARKFGRSG